MIVGLMNKSTNKVEITFPAKTVRYKNGFSEDVYKAFEVEEGKHQEGYYYDLDSDSVLYDETYTPFIDYAAQAENAVRNAVNFGQEKMIEFAGENVLMGITQAGKTKEVADYLTDVTRYIQTGSLYEVMNEIDSLIALGVPTNLDPFITETRLLNFKQKIQDFLS